MEVAVGSHDFAGGAHFWAQDRVDTWEAGKGQNRLFHEQPGMLGRPLSWIVSVQVISSTTGSPAMTRAAIEAMALPTALATNGTVRGARD